MTKYLATQKAFTLIETIVYIALLSILLCGALGAVYQIDRSANIDSATLTTEDEGNFVLQKIDWALAGTSTLARIMSPVSGAYSNTLSILNVSGVRIDICRDAGYIKMREGRDVSLPCSDVSYLPLTTDNITASTLQFYYSLNTSGVPSAIEASTTLNNSEFDTQKIMQY